MIINNKSYEDCETLVPSMQADKAKCCLKHISYVGKVVGPVFQITIKQIFQIGEGEGPIEALYSFPYPFNSVVNGLSVKFGDNLLHATLKTKEKAKEEYEQAKQEGRQASLLTKEDPTCLSLKVNGIIPNQTVEVNTSLSGVASYRGGMFNLILPTTRFPENAGFYRNPNSDEDRKDVPYVETKTSFDVDYKADISISFHKAKNPKTDHFRVSGENTFCYVREQVRPDHDFSISWLPETTDDEANKVYLFKERTGDETKAFLGLVVPKVQVSREPVEILIALDHSGSMNGAKWQMADKTCLEIVNSLRETDYFNVAIFHSQILWLSKETVQATEDNKKWAKMLIDDKTSGGTDMDLVFKSAAKMPKRFSNSSLSIITDGMVAGKLYTDKELDVRPINIVSIGSVTNQYFCHRVTDRSGGESICVLNDRNLEDCLAALRGLARTSSVENAPTIKVDKEKIEWIDCRNVPTNKPFLMSGITKKDGGFKISTPKQSKWKIEEVEISDFSILPIVGGLLVNKLEAEQIESGVKPEQIAETSLRFGVVSKETSLILVGEKVTEGPCKTEEVPLAREMMFYSPLNTPQNWSVPTRSLRSKGAVTCNYTMPQSCLRSAALGFAPQGARGMSGPQGCTGSTGFSGFSGCSGTSGFSGTSQYPAEEPKDKSQPTKVLIVSKGDLCGNFTITDDGVWHRVAAHHSEKVLIDLRMPVIFNVVADVIGQICLVTGRTKRIDFLLDYLVTDANVRGLLEKISKLFSSRSRRSGYGYSEVTIYSPFGLSFSLEEVKNAP